MPKLRLFGATKMRLADEYMTLPATSISPEVGRSSPAIERSVVVLPQPEGPSSVNSLPSGTSKLTSCAALTTVPRSPGYSVNSDLTLSTFVPVPVRPYRALIVGCPFITILLMLPLSRTACPRAGPASPGRTAG